MRTLVAGQPATLAEVTYAVENAHGTLPGSVGRVNDVAAALEILDPAEPTILFIVVDDPGDPQLAQVRALVARGARVIVLAKEPSAELRVAAIKAGVREVLFAPWTPARVQARLAGAGAATGLVEIATQTDFRAILLPEGTKDQIPTTVRSLSSTALTVDIALPRETIVRAAIEVPPPARLPVLFARAVGVAGSTTTLRFIGLTADEETLLKVVIRGESPAPFEDDGRTRIAQQLPGETVDLAGSRAAIGRVIADLDVSVLREAPAKWLGLNLPVLTDSERVSMASGGPLAEVAVWRTRAHVIASILEAQPFLATSELPFDEWRKGLSDARGLIRAEVGQRMADGDANIVREARDVQARLNAVSDRIDRLAREAGLDVQSDSGPLESPQLGPATFERAPVLAPKPSGAKTASPPLSTGTGARRYRAAFLGFLTVASIFVLVGVRYLSHTRRTVDIGRTGVAQFPVLEVGGIRVRSQFREAGSGTVIVVDRSWYDGNHSATPESARAAARLLADALDANGRVSIRDYSGRRLAQIDDDADAVTATALTAGTAGTASPSTPAPPSPKAKRPVRAPASPSR